MFSVGGIKGLAAFATIFLEGVTIKRGSLKVGSDRRLFPSGNFNARPTLSSHSLKAESALFIYFWRCSHESRQVKVKA